MGFAPYWNYKPTNAIHSDGHGVYTKDKILSLSIIKKSHLKSDIIDGSIQDGVTQPILFSFVSKKPSCCKIIRQPETIRYKKINKSVLNTATFYLEDNDHKQVDFNGETLIFTLQMIKI